MTFRSRRTHSAWLLVVSALSIAGCEASTSAAPSDESGNMGGSPGGDGDGAGADMGGASFGDDVDEPEAPAVPTCPASPQGYATEVVEHQFGPGQDFGRDEFPGVVLGGPRGGGTATGSLHVASLGNGGSVVLGFGSRTIVDGPGVDFIVFENAFWAGGNAEAPVAELGVVEVSADGEQWVAFECSAGDGPTYGDCSGWRPAEANVVDPEAPSAFDAEVAGGDQYDLADVGLDEARYVRITDLEEEASVYDLDAVAVVNGRCD